jgi:hydroxymethylbilane synthase
MIIGTRASILARTQTHHTLQLLKEKFPELGPETRLIKSEGDVSTRPLSEIGGRGIFTAHLSNALLDGTIDVAVHSLKDLPTADCPGLILGAILEREDPRDVIISKVPLHELPTGAHIGSGSLRRRAQLLNLKKGLNYSEIRGNVHTRIQKVIDGEYDATLLAQAGLNRLEHLSDQPPSALLAQHLNVYPIDIEDMTPAVAQGAVALECRSNDAATLNFIQQLDHAPSRKAVEVERKLLKRLGGGCQIPFAAHVTKDNMVHLIIADEQGYCQRLKGPVEQAEALMDQLLKEGQKIIDSYID